MLLIIRFIIYCAPATNTFANFLKLIQNMFDANASSFDTNVMRSKKIQIKKYPHFLREGAAKPRPLSKNGDIFSQKSPEGAIALFRKPNVVFYDRHWTHG